VGNAAQTVVATSDEKEGMAHAYYADEEVIMCVNNDKAGMPLSDDESVVSSQESNVDEKEDHNEDRLDEAVERIFRCRGDGGGEVHMIHQRAPKLVFDKITYG
jgi:hypothetical protein